MIRSLDGRLDIVEGPRLNVLWLSIKNRFGYWIFQHENLTRTKFYFDVFKNRVFCFRNYNNNLDTKPRIKINLLNFQLFWSIYDVSVIRVYLRLNVFEPYKCRPITHRPLGAKKREFLKAHVTCKKSFKLAALTKSFTHNNERLL